MKCEYCGLKEEARMAMRTSAIDGNIKTVNICLDCLDERLFDFKTKPDKFE
jgi:hypothetical protein